MKILFSILLFIIGVFPSVADGGSTTSRKERNYVAEGNKLYRSGNYQAAVDTYNKALEINYGNEVALYNIAMAKILHGRQLVQQSGASKDSVRNEILTQGLEQLQRVAAIGGSNPGLADKANYNLGNLSFNEQNYQQAISYYKQSLRLNPDNDSARKNLRIAQKKLQEQNQDKNKDNNQNQDKNNEQNNQDNNQNKDQNSDKDKNEQNQEQNSSQPENDKINRQAAAQILQSVENKENAKRASMKAMGKEKSDKNRRNVKNW